MKNIFRLLLWVTVVTIPVISGYAQGKGNLSGVVKDDMGETLPGAAIIVKGTTQNCHRFEWSLYIVGYSGRYL